MWVDLVAQSLNPATLPVRAYLIREIACCGKLLLRQFVLAMSTESHRQIYPQTGLGPCKTSFELVECSRKDTYCLVIPGTGKRVASPPSEMHFV
jgi:hypothetical protein